MSAAVELPGGVGGAATVMRASVLGRAGDGVVVGGEWKPGVNPWLIAVAVMLGTFMEVLDTSVANVALPHIAGNLSASTDEATWVLTSYLVSNAIILPATGWLSRFFGRKRFLMVCIGIFTISSFLCGAAQNLGMLVLARVIQGAGGGALQPIAQAVLLESFPVAKRGLAMSVYTLGIIFAPVIGPTVGGWLTDNYSWRWTFYINIPIGVLAVLMVNAFVDDPPHIKDARPGRIDYIGFGLLALWLAAFQIVLDKGQEADWFSARWVRWFTAAAAAGFVAFVWRELTAGEPIVNLRVLKNRNFATATAVVTIVGVVLYGTTALLPLFLQNLMGYPALQSGLAVSPRGIGSIAAILVISRFVGKIDPRVLVVAALGLLAYSSFLLARVDLQVSSLSVTWPIIINGAAVSMTFIPLTTAATGTLSTGEIGAATGIYNLMRNLGGAVGISMMTTMLARRPQTHQTYLAAHVTPYSPAYQVQLAKLAGYLSGRMSPVDAVLHAKGLIYQQVRQQATLLTFVDCFRTMGVLCLVCVPFVLFLRRPTRAGPVAVH